MQRISSQDADWVESGINARREVLLQGLPFICRDFSRSLAASHTAVHFHTDGWVRCSLSRPICHGLLQLSPKAKHKPHLTAIPIRALQVRSFHGYLSWNREQPVLQPLCAL